MDIFSSMIRSSDPRVNIEEDGKKWDPDTALGGWASILQQVTGADKIDENPMSTSAANIHAVTKCASDPMRVVEALQGFATRRVVNAENNEADIFSEIIHENEPRQIGIVDDETRGNLYEIFGKGISDSDIVAIVNSADGLLEFIQNNHPELGIQLVEGFRDGWRAARARKPKAAPGKRWKKGDQGDWTQVHAGDVEKGNQEFGALAGKAANLATRHIPNMTKKLNKGLSWADPRYASGGMKKFYQVAGGVGRGLGNFAGALVDPSSITSKNSVERDSMESDPVETPLVVGDRVKFVDQKGVERVGDIISIMHTQTGIEAEVQYIDSTGKTSSESMEATQLTRVNENLNMKTFDQIIKDTGRTLLEQPEEGVEEPVEGEMPEAPPAPPIDTEELAPDDTDKLQVDMLEQVRRALVVNPNDIDREVYMKLTTQVTFENVDELKPLLNKVVQNHYPDLEMGDVEPGPGV